MLDLAKQAVLQGLNSLGYRVLKKQEHERLLAVAGQAQASNVSLSPPVVPAPPPGPDPQITTFVSTTEGAELAKLLESLKGICDLPLPRVAALYAIADYLTRVRIEGEVVDCGYGNTGNLAVLATAFAQLGDRSRRLALFDTSADPLHRPEFEFELWGTNRDPLSMTNRWHKSQNVEPAPRELAATGYPVENVSIKRYPREPIMQSGPVAFLGLTSACYPSNRTAIATFLSRVSSGGVIAVEPDPIQKGRLDAVEEFLRNEGPKMLFLHVAPDYRVGMKP